MSGKKSRNKGSRNERAAAKAFGGWWGKDFARTPSSGGFSTHQFREDWNAAGDLVTADSTFPFCVEVKAQEGWNLEQMIKNDGCIIFDWWRQATEECPSDKVPLLVFKRNNQPWFCMFDCDDLDNISYDIYDKLHDEKSHRHFRMLLSKEITGTYAGAVFICQLTALFDTEPKEWKKDKTEMVKARQARLSYRQKK